MSDWLPLSTAPRDGTIFDAWLGDAEPADIDFYCTPGTRRAPGWAWYRDKFRPISGLTQIPVFVVPTDWMPLPDEPERSAGPRCVHGALLLIGPPCQACVAEVEAFRQKTSGSIMNMEPPPGYLCGQQPDQQAHNDRMAEPTERDREMAEQLVIRWTTGRFADRMDDQDCEELQDAIAMKFATAREEGRREAIEECATFVEGIRAYASPRIMADHMAFRIRQLLSKEPK
jgi:hypothetical protein